MENGFSEGLPVQAALLGTGWPETLSSHAAHDNWPLVWQQSHRGFITNIIQTIGLQMI